jgi:hypothetical protein
MICRLWKPGTNKELDDLFEWLRACQHNNHRDSLWANYSAESFQDCLALTIFFNDQGVPETCSSIARRDIWPAGVFRICNRLWKRDNRFKGFNRDLSAGLIETVKAQLGYLEAMKDFRLAFISRSTVGWQDYLSCNLNKTVGTNFVYDDLFYLTCAHEQERTCWQRIIYNGDPEALKSWSKKSLI